MSGSMQRQSGISIVEALVTMLILVIVLGGVYQIFQSSSLTYRMQEGMSRVQENGRFAMDFLVNDIRMGGYKGCISSISANNIINNADDYLYDFNTGIQGFEADDVLSYPVTDNQNLDGTWSSETQSNISASIIKNTLGATASNILAGSDIITARFGTNPISRVENISGNGTIVQIDDSSFFDTCDVVIINDCNSADIFQVMTKNVSGSTLELSVNGTECTQYPGNIANQRLSIRLPDSEVMMIESVSYFIALNNMTPALYRKTGTGTSQELVEGVEAMKILYGLDVNNDFNIDSYNSTSEISNWGAVRSVRVALLLRTPEEIRGMDLDTNEYDLFGTIFGPANDRRMRRVFEATIGLRNSLR